MNYEFFGRLALLIAGISLGYLWGKFSTARTLGFATKITRYGDKKYVTIVTGVGEHEFSIPKGSPVWDVQVDDALIVEYHIFRGFRISEFAGPR